MDPTVKNVLNHLPGVWWEERDGVVTDHSENIDLKDSGIWREWEFQIGESTVHLALLEFSA